MKESTNDITGDKLKTKPTTDKFRDNYDDIDWGQPVNYPSESDSCDRDDKGNTIQEVK